MAITIGLNANHADSSICVFDNNKLIFALEEERINRIKHWAGVPLESIRYALNYCKINPNEINNITLNTNPFSNIDKKISYYLRNYIFSQKSNEIFKRQNLKFKIKNIINEFLDNSKINYRYIDHHLSHLASAFYPSKFDNAVGISIDGFGDFCSCTIAECSNNKIKIIDKTYFPNSIGIFYEAITQFIGFKKYGEEYKMMGLSSYGKSVYSELLLENLFLKNDTSRLNIDFFNHTKRNYSYSYSGSPVQNKILNDKLYNALNLKENDISSNKEIQCDLAASAQKIFEKYLIKKMEKISKKKFSKNIVYAGGCALNSLANKKIFNYFDNVFIPYAPGDAGGAIGSALYNLSSRYKNFENLDTPYLGPGFSREYIHEQIKQFSFSKKAKIKSFNNFDNLIEEVTSLLIKKSVIGLFNGRMEFGARALGNRSIIANPIPKDMKDIINQKIKKRENFRPFAPAILIEEKDKWFSSGRSNPYMSNVEVILNDKRSIIPAVTHFDGTGRVQSVSKNTNKFFYLLIKNFFKQTGVPILLNTSFNENEPIVFEPYHALSCYDRTEIDAIVLENFLIINE